MLLLSLKNVVIFHKSDHHRIGDKINQVVEGMEILANRLIERECIRAAAFLNTYSEYSGDICPIIAEWNLHSLELEYDRTTYG